MAKLGTDGPAGIALVESGVVDRATANSSPRTPRATNRMTRSQDEAPHRKLLADSRSEPGVNAEPAA